MFLLIADRRAYIYRGDPSTLAWWMVRISNVYVSLTGDQCALTNIHIRQENPGS